MNSEMIWRKNRVAVLFVLCLVFLLAAERIYRQFASSHHAMQLRAAAGNQRSDWSSAVHSVPSPQVQMSAHLREELEDAGEDYKSLTAPKWVETSSWNLAPRRVDFGLRKARPPQYVWLDWFEVQGAARYEIFVAYSKVPFGEHEASYKMLASTAKTEYHSGDPAYLAGAQRRYQTSGFYRFRVAAMTADKVQGPLSADCELVLDQKAPLVPAGLSFAEKHFKHFKP